MIEVKNLTKHYGGAVGIEDVSFKIEKGEILGLLGPNAAGKTTTIRILTCYMPPTSGYAAVDGQDIFSAPLNVRKQIGYLPENVPLYPDMRTSEYLTYRAKLREIPRSKIRKRVDSVIERCGIKDVRRDVIGTLSKGYRQRVGLAGALVSDPPILILDEPTIGLDPRQIREVRELIKELGGSHTILLSSHILPEVEMICGRVIIIDRGKIVAMDTPSKLVEQMRGKETISIEVKGGGDTAAELRRITGVEKVEMAQKGEAGIYSVECAKGKDLREVVSRTIMQSGGIILEMRMKTLSLEDVFMHLTMKEKTIE
jgi:ABC-2 type transport system ATP-binding protein